MDPFLLYGWQVDASQYQPYRLQLSYPCPSQRRLPALVTQNQPHPALRMSVPLPVSPLESPRPTRDTTHMSTHSAAHTPPLPSLPTTDLTKRRIAHWLSRVEACKNRASSPRTRQSRKQILRTHSSTCSSPAAASSSLQSPPASVESPPGFGETGNIDAASDHTRSITPILPEYSGTPIFGNCDPPLFDLFDLEYLPDPVSNPLITTTPGEMKEEIHRLKMHSMHLQRRKEESDRQWRTFKSPDTLTHFLKLSASFAKVEMALRYAIRYTRQHNIPIDLDELSFRYTRHMMTQPADAD